jgi:hypothetical protein
MRVFSAHMMSEEAGPVAAHAAPPRDETVVPTEEARVRYAALAEVLCDEELLDAGPEA